MNNENTTIDNEAHNSPITIGQLILKTREEKGLSLKTISQQTKIHIGLLENLEADQMDKLPSRAYVRGFVKSAAKILSLDQDYALNLLDQAYNNAQGTKKEENQNYEMKSEAARNTLSSISTTPLEAVKSVTASSSLFLAKVAVVVLIVGVVGVNIKNLLEKSKEEPVKLPEVLSTLQKKTPAVKAPLQITEPKIEVPTEPIKVNIIEDKNVKSEIIVNDIKLKAISIAEKQFTETSLPAEKIDELLPAKYRVQPVKGMQTLFLNASEGDSWLTYKVDEKEIKKFVLRQGRTLFLRGSVIRILIGNAKSLAAFYNNKPVDLSNDINSARNIVLPEEMKTKFRSPLFVFLPNGSVVTSDEYINSNQEKTEAKQESSSASPANPKP